MANTMKRLLIELTEQQYAAMKAKKGKMTWREVLECGLGVEQQKSLTVREIQDMIDESIQAFEAKIRGR